MRTTLLILAFLGCWGLFVSLLSYGLFALDTRRRSDPLARRARAFGLGRCVALGVPVSLGSLAVMALSYPLGLILGRLRPSPAAGTGVPAVLVHGLYHNASAWVVARPLMAGSGLGPVYAPNFDTFRTGFNDMAEKLSGVILEVSRRHGDAPVALMGHSLGGLLIKAVSDDERLRGRIRSIVTLAAPWRGSRLAALAVGRVGRGLREDGPIAAEAARHRVPAHIPRLCLYSVMDNMVVPTSSLLPPDEGWQAEETAFLPHLALLYHVPTLRRAIRFLARANEAGTPSPARTPGMDRPSPAATGLADGVENPPA